jgi:large subunit ribosomal protein L10
MALSREKKSEILADTANLLNTSKLTVMAKYEGTSVKSLQQLRREARENGTEVRVIKNRLFRLALDNDERFKEADKQALIGQLLYAFNADDEVAPAKSLADFAKRETQIEFVGALTSDGQLVSPDDVKALAALPSKDQLRGILAGTLAAPLSGFVNVLAGNVRGVLNVLNARSEQIG